MFVLKAWSTAHFKGSVRKLGNIVSLKISIGTQQCEKVARVWEL